MYTIDHNTTRPASRACLVSMVITLDQTVELMGDFKEMSRGYVLTHCPWHDDSQMSLLVFEDGWYRCLAQCENSGPDGSGRIERLYEELSNPGTVRRPQTNGKNGYIRPPKLPTDIEDIERLVWRAHEALRKNDDFKWYLTMRGVDDRIETAKLGWYEGWITCPILTENQQVKGVYLRATPPQEKVTGLRFTQPVGQRPLLYCPDWQLWKSSRSVVVCYGMMDALVLSSLRFPVVTTSGGSKSFDPEWLDHWRKPIVIIPDKEGDDKAASDLAAALGWRAKILRLSYDDNVKDPADYAKESIGRKKELAKLVASVL